MCVVIQFGQYISLLIYTELLFYSQSSCTLTLGFYILKKLFAVFKFRELVQ